MVKEEGREAHDEEAGLKTPEDAACEENDDQEGDLLMSSNREEDVQRAFKAACTMVAAQAGQFSELNETQLIMELTRLLLQPPLPDFLNYTATGATLSQAANAK